MLDAGERPLQLLCERVVHGSGPRKRTWAREGGVMVRVGQTEGSVDLARMAGLKPAGVICEIMDEDGTMARMSSIVHAA